MGKIWMLFAAVILTMSMVAGCVKTYTVPEQLINTGINKEFVIALDCALVEAVYDWKANYDDTILSLVDSRYEASEKQLPEISGIWRFKFRALKTGETEITMTYVTMLTELKIDPGRQLPIQQLDEKVFTVNIK